MGEVDTPCVLPDQSSASSLARCTLDVGSCSPSLQVLSAVVGHAAPLLLPPTLTHYAAVLLFLFFGFRMLRRPTYHSIPPAHYLPHAQASTPALHHCTARTPHLGLASPRLASPRLTSPRLASPRFHPPLPLFPLFPGTGLYHGTLPTSSVFPTWLHGNHGSALVTKQRMVEGLQRQAVGRWRGQEVVRGRWRGQEVVRSHKHAMRPEVCLLVPLVRSRCR